MFFVPRKSFSKPFFPHILWTFFILFSHIGDAVIGEEKRKKRSVRHFKITCCSALLCEVVLFSNRLSILHFPLRRMCPEKRMEAFVQNLLPSHFHSSFEDITSSIWMTVYLFVLVTITRFFVWRITTPLFYSWIYPKAIET